MASTPRRYHHGDLRRALLDEAERALERGAELNLRELARAVDVSPGAPFRHFATKRALVDDLAREGFERLGTALDAALISAPPEFTERLAAVARAYVAFAVAHPALVQLMIAAKHRDAALADTAAEALAIPLDLVAGAQREGQLVAGPHVGTTVCALLDGIASLSTNGGPGSRGDELDELVTAAIVHLLDGLRPSAAPAAS